MKRIFHPYTEWEDYKNGMYSEIENKEESIKKAKDLLADPDKLYLAMTRVTKEWDIATMVNLTNIEENRRAWMGQSACCLECGAPEDLTRTAWMQLTDDQRKKANLVAEKVIYEWTANHIKKYLNDAKDIFRQGCLDL